MSYPKGWCCLKCGAHATPESIEADAPLCWAHGGGESPEVQWDERAPHLLAWDVDVSGDYDIR